MNHLIWTYGLQLWSNVKKFNFNKTQKSSKTKSYAPSPMPHHMFQILLSTLT